MSFKEKDLLAYLDRIKVLFQDNTEKELDLTNIEEVKIKGLECLYLFDLPKNQIVFHKGFEQMFGFREGMINLPFIFNK